jgi:hypothetical protein
MDKYGEQATKLKFGRMEFFIAASDFLAVYQEMVQMLENYTKLPTSKQAEINKRNERLERLAKFYNTSHELLEMFDKWYEKSFQGAPMDEHGGMAHNVDQVIKYARRQFDEAIKENNTTRAKVCYDIMLRGWAIDLDIHALKATHPKQPLVPDADGVVVVAVEKKDWMHEGTKLVRKRSRIITNKYTGYRTVEQYDVHGEVTKVLEYTALDGEELKSYVYDVEIHWNE